MRTRRSIHQLVLDATDRWEALITFESIIEEIVDASEDELQPEPVPSVANGLIPGRVVPGVCEAESQAQVVELLCAVEPGVLDYRPDDAAALFTAASSSSYRTGPRERSVSVLSVMEC